MGIILLVFKVLLTRPIQALPVMTSQTLFTKLSVKGFDGAK